MSADRLTTGNAIAIRVNDHMNLVLPNAATSRIWVATMRLIENFSETRASHGGDDGPQRPYFQNRSTRAVSAWRLRIGAGCFACTCGLYAEEAASAALTTR